MTVLAVTKAREEFSDTLNRVAYSKERVVVERRGKPVTSLLRISNSSKA
jgi:prevent-host-death family protein